MAETKMIQVDENFDLAALVEKLKQTYQAKGFNVSALKAGNGVSITFSKDDEGIKKFVGMAQVITANISMNDRTMLINFTDAEWMGKIVGFLIGWFLCWIPWIFVGMGGYKQMELPKTIVKDIQMNFSGGPIPF